MSARDRVIRTLRHYVSDDEAEQMADAFAAECALTIRDRFAMAALTGMLGPHVEARGRVEAEAIAEGAYLVADAMLAARGAK